MNIDTFTRISEIVEETTLPLGVDGLTIPISVTEFLKFPVSINDEVANKYKDELIKLIESDKQIAALITTEMSMWVFVAGLRYFLSNVDIYWRFIKLVSHLGIDQIPEFQKYAQTPRILVLSKWGGAFDV